MRLVAVTGLLSMLLCLQAVADEPKTPFIAKKHVLGRVFMNDAERRQLDVLRKSQGTVATPGNASSNVVATQPESKNASKPAGYIVPSNGSPLQWIDGDFRRVSKVDIESAEDSQELQITRIADGDTSSKRAPKAENDDENRAPQ